MPNTDPGPEEAPPAALPLLAAIDLQDNLMVATHDLERLQRLLEHATEQLLGHFHEASAQLGQIGRIANQANAAGAANTTASPALAEALRQLHGAVTAMQFQDMSSQLITHLHRRLRNCADRLARDVMGDDDAEGAAVVEEAPIRPNPVTQDEMDAGSI